MVFSMCLACLRVYIAFEVWDPTARGVKVFLFTKPHPSYRRGALRPALPPHYTPDGCSNSRIQLDAVNDEDPLPSLGARHSTGREGLVHFA